MKKIFLILLIVTAQASAKPLKISIIDTGIDLKNKKLLPYISSESKDFSKSSSGIQDQHGHGTHIASLIVDRSGLSPEQLQIVVIKYYSQTASAEENLYSTIDAFRYSQKVGVQLVNYSAGGTQTSPLEKEALRQLQEAQILVIAAAGNEKSNSDDHPFYPASYKLSNILSVGAHDAKFQKVESSNFGFSNVHLSSFGKDIISDIPGNKKLALTGTSQATAIVTALTAKLMSVRIDLRNPDQIKEQLLKAAEYKESLKQTSQTSGTVHLERSLSIRSKRNPALFEALLTPVESL